MDCLNNEFKAVQVPGLKKLTGDGGYSYVVTLEGRLFLSGGKGSEGNLHEMIWSGANSMRLKKLHSMINARFDHQMTSFAAGKRLIVTGGAEKGTFAKMNECEVYDMGEDSWSSIAPMNEKRA